MKEMKLNEVELKNDISSNLNALCEDGGEWTRLNIKEAVASRSEMQELTSRLNQLSNPNLLINGDFRNPINQRGQTIYTDKGNTTTYTIDRWRLGAGSGRTVTINDGYISLYNNSVQYEGFLTQLFEAVYPEDDYTLTINVKKIDTTARVILGGDTITESQSFDLTEGINTFTVRLPIIDVTIVFGLNGTVDLYWIKLEKGTVSTPIVPRQYAEELMLCQRYYQNFNPNDNINELIFPCAFLKNITGFSGGFMLPTKMRTKPTVTITKASAYGCDTGDWLGMELDKIRASNNDNFTNSMFWMQYVGNYSSDSGNATFCKMILELDAEIY